MTDTAVCQCRNTFSGTRAGNTYSEHCLPQCRVSISDSYLPLPRLKVAWLLNFAR